MGGVHTLATVALSCQMLRIYNLLFFITLLYSKAPLAIIQKNETMFSKNLITPYLSPRDLMIVQLAKWHVLKLATMKHAVILPNASQTNNS